MTQAKFSLEEEQLEFLNQYQKYGFKDKSAVIRAALERLKADLERERLERSAELYAEVYEAEKELRELADSAIAEWPQ